MTADLLQVDAGSPPDAAPGESPVVRTVGLGRLFDERMVLCDINVTVPAGGSVALLGANGAGKSTLLRTFATLLAPSRGQLLLFGKPPGDETVRLRSRIGMISHQPMLYRDLSARENLVLFGKLYDLPDPGARAAELLEALGLADRAQDPVKTFSRGMTQRAAIARALVHDPDLLLADEPFDGLDAPSTATLEQLLRGLNAQGKTLIVSNHDIDRSLRLNERVVVLQRGRVVLDAPAAGLAAADVMKEMAPA